MHFGNIRGRRQACSCCQPPSPKARGPLGRASAQRGKAGMLCSQFCPWSELKSPFLPKPVTCNLEGSQLEPLRALTPGFELICRTCVGSDQRSAWAARQPGAERGGLDRGPGLAGKGFFRPVQHLASGGGEQGERGVEVGQRLPGVPGQQHGRHAGNGFSTTDSGGLEAQMGRARVYGVRARADCSGHTLVQGGTR